MKKRILPLLLALLCLCGCAGRGAAPAAYDVGFAEVMLNSGAFEGSEMAQVDLAVVPVLYGIDLTAITEGVCYIAANTSVSADELLVLVLTDEEAAVAAEQACAARVEAQIKVCESYCPAAVPRLEGARISRAGNTLVFAVGDPDVVNTVNP